MEVLLGSGVQTNDTIGCCCCLKEGNNLDISLEYYTSGHKEVYADMLKETFNIEILRVDGLPAPQICRYCVSRLREAALFRQMVSDSQMVIREHWQSLNYNIVNNTTNTDSFMEMSDLKVEAFPIVGPGFNETAGIDDDFDDDEILANLQAELARDEESEGGPLKRAREPRTELKRCKLIENVEDLPGNGQKDWSSIMARRGSGPILRQDSLKLLSNSTGCVFQWNKSLYRCFCCTEPFTDFSSLKDHTFAKHTIEQIEKRIIDQQNRLVKVEISTLSCKMCGEHLESFIELRSHLTEKHDIKFMQDEDLLVPFKINDDLQCQLCSEKFSLFRLLNIHMNKHYQKHVCCICGSAFSNAVFLNLHTIRCHRPYECKQCDTSFNSKLDKKNHDVEVHGVKTERKRRFPCPYCPERFFQESLRVKHLVDNHNMSRPQYKCDVCNKVFVTKSLLNNHVKTVHKKERNHQCDFCHKWFFHRSDVVRHKVTHTGEKKFSCSICNTPLATNDSLRRHMRRCHMDVQ